MPLFPSLEWAQILKDKIDSNPDYKKLSKDWEGSIMLQVQAAGILEKDFCIWLDPYHGDVRDMQVVDSPEVKKADFIFSAPYSVFKSLIKKEEDPVKVMMKGKIKVKGNMAYLLKHMKASQTLIGVLDSIDTQFPDEG